MRDMEVFIDSRLKFVAHISKIVNDSFGTLGVISHIIRNLHSYSCILHLFNSLVLSKFKFSTTVLNSLGIIKPTVWNVCDDSLFKLFMIAMSDIKFMIT